jgi:ABC-type xylose transport system permease subunit
VVSGVFNTAQQVGGALGLALLTALAAGRTGTSPVPQTAQALTSGYHLAWAAGAVLGVAAIAVAVIALRSPRRRQRDVTHLAGEETSRAPANSP